VIFGVLEKDTLKAMGDLNPREMVTLGTLAVLTILFGFYPAPLLDASAASVEAMVGLYQNAVGAAPAVLEATAH
jgi:NADH-quinone oxidoreductase subunit M